MLTIKFIFSVFSLLATKSEKVCTITVKKSAQTQQLHSMTRLTHKQNTHKT